MQKKKKKGIDWQWYLQIVEILENIKGFQQLKALGNDFPEKDNKTSVAREAFARLDPSNPKVYTYIKSLNGYYTKDELKNKGYILLPDGDWKPFYELYNVLKSRYFDIEKRNKSMIISIQNPEEYNRKYKTCLFQYCRLQESVKHLLSYKLPRDKAEKIIELEKRLQQRTLDGIQAIDPSRIKNESLRTIDDFVNKTPWTQILGVEKIRNALKLKSQAVEKIRLAQKKTQMNKTQKHTNKKGKYLRGEAKKFQDLLEFAIQKRFFKEGRMKRNIKSFYEKHSGSLAKFKKGRVFNERYHIFQTLNRIYKKDLYKLFTIYQKYGRLIKGGKYIK